MDVPVRFHMYTSIYGWLVKLCQKIHE